MRHRSATFFAFALIVVCLSPIVTAQPTPASVSFVTPTSSCALDMTATVQLSGPAPAAGLIIQLTSSLPATLPVPPSVTAAAGASSASFLVRCVPVNQSVAVTLTATAGGVSRSAVLNVLAPVLRSLALKPSGGNLVGAVTLEGPAPSGGVIVTLSRNPSLATVPSTVLVPAGSSSENFEVTNLIPVSQPTALTITGTGLGVTRSVIHTLQPAAPSSLTFQLPTGAFVSTVSLTGGDGVFTKVTLNGPAGGNGVTVTLASGNPAVTVPASVIVSPGQSEATFLLETNPVAQTSTVNVTATTSGVSKTAPLTVLQPAPSYVTLNPSSVRGGTTVTGVVGLNKPAPAGLVIQVFSSNSTVASPSQVIMTTGALAHNFVVSVRAVSAPTAVTITVRSGGVSKTAGLTVH